LKIARRISNQPGIRKVDGEVGNRALDHPDRGLAAIAFDFENSATAREARIGVMGTMVDGGQLGSLLFEQGVQFFVNLFEGGLGQLSTGDRGLIRHDDGSESGLVESSEALGGTGEELEVVRCGEPVNVDVERAVSVEKYCRDRCVEGFSMTWL
jgi:hypothetical protein